MVKKTVTFTDFEGKEITKDFYFNLSKMEVRVLDRKIPGGLANMIHQIQQEKDTDRLLDFLDLIILESYGERGDDDRFVKEDSKGRRLSTYFKISEAWDVLFTTLLQNEKELEEFVTGIVPKDVADQAQKDIDSARNGGTLTPIENISPMMPK